MLRHYQLVSEERLVTREREILSDRLTALQTMSAGLAHEVRNPLNAAKLQLELLERRLRRQSADPRLVDPIGLAHHEIQRLTEMLNEFLAFARPPELHLEQHDAAAVVREVIELEGPYAERSGVTLKFEPAGAAELSVDPGKLHQVVQNLVRNAIEAASPNGHVEVAVTLAERVVHVRVSDDGPGMTEEVRARMFEPFFSTKEGGTGMGMSIVHSFVAMHDGRINVVTGANGTQIDVGLPRHRR
jgi:two-component system, NtrC family, sensor histidine kinase HydH